VLVLKKYSNYLIVFLVAFIIYLSNSYIDYKRDVKSEGIRNLATSYDIIPNTFLPIEILKYGSIKLNDVYKNLIFIGGKTPYFIIDVNGNKYSSYPVLTGLMATPFYVLPTLLNEFSDLTRTIDIIKVLLVGRVAASFFAALSVAVVYACLKKISKGERYIYLLTAFYALGTTTWSISSRSLWQHGPSQLFLALSLFFLLKEQEKLTRSPFLVGLFLAMSVLVRPTNIIFAALISLYIFIYSKKDLIKFSIPMVISAILLVSYNKLIFGSFLTEGYGARSNFNWSTSLLESIPGFLYSPARSFLFISPPLVLSLFAFYKSLKTKIFGNKNNVLYKFITVGCLGTILLFSKWYTWDGANGFGYRMLTDIVPFLIIFVYEVTKDWINKYKNILLVLVLYSILIQFKAVFYLKSRCEHRDNWNFNCLTMFEEHR
jgi:hypothetical protein